MKINHILSIALLSVATLFTACEDKEDYTPGAESPGAYFPQTAPVALQVPQNETSFDVTVMRTTTSSATTYDIIATDEKGLFDIPASVTFEADKLSATLSISYDPAVMDIKEQYPLKLTLANVDTEGTIYGPSSYEFTVQLMPTIESHYVDFGTYTYDFVVKGYQENIPIYQGHVEGDEPLDSVVIIGGYQSGQTSDDKFVPWLGGLSDNIDQLTLMLHVHYDKQFTDGTYPVTIEPQGLGVVSSQFGEFMIIDEYNFFKNLNGEEYAAPAFGSSYFDPERGRYTLSVIYYGSEMEPGYIFANGNVVETLQLDGYPDYELSLGFNGLFTAADFTQTYALVEVSSGADVNQVKVAVGSGTPQEIYDQMKAESIEMAEVPGNTTEEARLAVSGDGLYRAVAVAYADGEEVANYVTTFRIGTGATVPNDPNAWLSHGWADFTDGFVIPAIWYYRRTESSFAPYTVEEYTNMRMYQVEVQTAKENPNIIRIINPYGADSDFPFNSLNNVNPNLKYNIVIDATDHECVLITPQETGFGMRVTVNDQSQQLPGADRVYNYEGGLFAENGYSIDDIKALYNRYRYTLSTYTEDDGIGTITCPIPFPSADIFGRRNLPAAKLQFIQDPTSAKVRKFRQATALRAVKAAPQVPAALRFVERDYTMEPLIMTQARREGYPIHNR